MNLEFTIIVGIAFPVGNRLKMTRWWSLSSGESITSGRLRQRTDRSYNVDGVLF